jgi:hypothetical protein
MLVTARTMVAAVLGASVAVLSACGGGGGPLVSTTGGGRDDPGSTWDQPPNGRDSTGNACIECNVAYSCTSGPQPGNGQNGSGTTSIDLSTATGQCTPAVIDLVCSGALFGADGCTGGGGGPFTCGSVTCSPVQMQLPPGSAGFGADGG